MEDVPTAGEELEVEPLACRLFCSACMEDESSASAEAMLRVLGERNSASDDAATAGGLSRVPAAWCCSAWIDCESRASIDAMLRLVGVALAIVEDIDPIPKLFKALLLPNPKLVRLPQPSPFCSEIELVKSAKADTIFRPVGVDSTTP